jgi:hypothetical protein
LTGAIDFLLIGAEKSGTTWLADMLRQHPQVYVPAVKELFYFNERFLESPELHNFNFDQPLDWYLSHFRAAAPGQLRGEASPAYLCDPIAPRRIFDFNPRLQLLAALRHPVERAFSQYLFYIQRGVLGNIPFEDALLLRPDLIERGRYAAQLERYYALFPASQIGIFFYDDLTADSRRFLQSVQSFLGVPAFIPADIAVRANVTGAPRFPWLNRLIARVRYPLRKYNPPWLIRLIRRSGLADLQERLRLYTRPLDEKPALSPQTRARLCAAFAADVEKLAAMTQRDLKGWLQ